MGMNEPTISRLEVWKGRLKRFSRWIRRGLPFGMGVLAALLALLLYNALVPAPQPLTTRQVSDIVSQTMASATPPPAFSEHVYQAIQPSLVLIQAQMTDKSGTTDDSLGSGVVIDDSGDILTSLHVVANATVIQVTFADGTTSNAKITTSQAENDIAVLQADQLPEQVVPATLGNPNSVQIGDEAYVVGNPFGLYSSMTAGVISGFNRTFQPADSTQELHGLIQIDAAVNPGNSGGPLLNRDGQVIGIIEGIVNPTGQKVFIGIGFAVPINIAGGAVGLPPY